MTMALLVRINVLGKPVVNRMGMACSVHIPVEEGVTQLGQRGLRRGRAHRLAVLARGDRGEVRQVSEQGRLSTRVSSQAAVVRGTHWQYSFAQVPSAMTASSPEFSASTSGWLSLATA